MILSPSLDSYECQVYSKATQGQKLKLVGSKAKVPANLEQNQWQHEDDAFGRWQRLRGCDVVTTA